MAAYPGKAGPPGGSIVALVQAFWVTEMRFAVQGQETTKVILCVIARSGSLKLLYNYVSLYAMYLQTLYASLCSTGTRRVGTSLLVHL